MPYKNREQRLAAQKKHYETNKSQYMNNQYQRRVERAEWFYEYKKTLKCERCPENHPACLAFHHPDPLQKDMSVSNLVRSGYSKEKILEEMAKCQVLCANCHHKLHWQERIDCGKSRLYLDKENLEECC
jgi:hypothetical protein